MHSITLKLRTLQRGLKLGEWELLKPMVNGFSGEYPHEHSLWEYCLKGIKEYPVWISDHLQASRTVSPMIVSSISEWESLTSGGEWPTAATKGYRTGLPKQLPALPINSRKFNNFSKAGKKKNGEPVTAKGTPHKPNDQASN